MLFYLIVRIYITVEKKKICTFRYVFIDYLWDHCFLHRSIGTVQLQDIGPYLPHWQIPEQITVASHFAVILARFIHATYFFLKTGRYDLILDSS